MNEMEQRTACEQLARDLNISAGEAYLYLYRALAATRGDEQVPLGEATAPGHALPLYPPEETT